jgi:hypothetical protein
VQTEFIHQKSWEYGNLGNKKDLGFLIFHLADGYLWHFYGIYSYSEPWVNTLLVIRYFPIGPDF